MIKTIPGNFTLNFDWFKSFCEIIEFENISDKIYISINLNENNFNLEDFKDNLAKNYLDLKKKFNWEVAFEELVKKINKNYWEKLSWFNVVIALISSRNIYVTHSWDAECYLLRNNKLNIILESILPKIDSENQIDAPKNDIFVNMASGYLSDDDILIFSSKRILRRFTSLQLIEWFQDWIAEWLEMMKWIFQNEEYSISVSAIHIKMNSPFESRTRIVSSKKEKFLSFIWKVQEKTDDFIVFISKKIGQPYENVQKWFVALIWILILFSLISMIAFSSQDSQKKAMYDQYKIEILKVDKELEVAESRAMMWSTADSNAILDRIEEKVSWILSSWMFREESISILSKIDEMRDDINKIKRFKDLETIKLVDLSKEIWASESIKWIVKFWWFSFAYTENKIYKISLNKIEKTFDFVEWNKIKDVSIMADRWLMLIFTDSNSLFEFNWKTFEKVSSWEKPFKSFVDFSSYSRFIYLLEKWKPAEWTWAVISKWGIFKYQKNRWGYSDWKAYLPWENFSEAVSIAIDWSIYILHKWWFISQYYSWKPVNFMYKWDSELIKDSEEIYTKLDYSYLYLLDKTNNKIIILRKTKEWAQFVRQYIFESDIITWFFVDKNEQEMTVSWKNKIYKVSLIK